jgi:hypothetical protein
MTNAEYEARYDEIDSDDPAIHGVFCRAWHLYDDFKTHALTGEHALTKQGRREVARWVLFLYTDRKYRWPKIHMLGWSGCALEILAMVSWGLLGGAADAHYWSATWAARRRPDAKGDPTNWPFFRRSDLEEAIKHPPYLAGKLSRA